MTPRPFGPRGVIGTLIFVGMLLVIARTLAAFATRVAPYLSVHYDWRLEIGLVLGQVAFQWGFMWRQPRERKISYAWILIAVSGLGATLLWPLLALLPHTTLLVTLGWFFGVVGIMFGAHWLLVVRHQLPKWLCGTWVVYRLLLLVLLVRLP